MKIPVRIALTAAVALAAAPPSVGSEPEPATGTTNAVQAVAFDLAGHPSAEAADLYKFLHQAMFGPGHAIASTEQAAVALQNEITELGAPVPEEDWCDTLGGDPFLVRVNLRPFVANAFESVALVEAFVATANANSGDPQQMAVALDLVVRWLRTEDREDLARELQDLAREMEEKGYPSVHHSAAYKRAYRPAYRVIELSMATAHEWCGSAY